MTRSQTDLIIERLDAQSAKIDRLQSEIDQMKGGSYTDGTFTAPLEPASIDEPAAALGES